MLPERLREAPHLRCAWRVLHQCRWESAWKGFPPAQFLRLPASQAAPERWAEREHRHRQIPPGEPWLAELERVGIAGGDAIAESRAGDDAACAVGTAGAVAIARSGGHIESARLRDVDRSSLRRSCGNAVGIAEAAGLHLLRSGRSMVCGAELPVEKTLVLTICLGITGAAGRRNRIQLLGGDFHFRSGSVFHLRLGLRLRSG